jgi:hypothetical protein
MRWAHPGRNALRVACALGPTSRLTRMIDLCADARLTSVGQVLGEKQTPSLTPAGSRYRRDPTHDELGDPVTIGPDHKCQGG